MILNAETYGEGRPLLIAHGLFGSARNWRAIAKRLSADRQVITVDMRNHAGSDWAGSHTYMDMAQDLADTMDGPCDVLGHSMGGKAAMVLALTRPDLVDRLIVADIAPITYPHTQAHNIDILRQIDLKNLTRRSEADAQLANHIDDPAMRAFLLQSLVITPEGNSWALNLEVLDKDMDNIMSFPELPAQFDGPTLFLRGGASDYVSDQNHDKIRTLFPNAQFETIDGAGHWLHAEAPKPFLEHVTAFLN